MTVTDDGLLVVDTEGFQGPLDLLLHLIRVQDIDIFDIPIARITRQFLAAIEQLQRAGVDEAGEFLELASALIRIKARMLLPRAPGEEDHDPRAELVRRLLEYEQIREIADRLRSAEDDRGRRHGKGHIEPRERGAPVDLPLDATWDQVMAAALQLRDPAERDQEHRVTTRTVAMSEKVSLIVATLERVRRVEFASLVAPWRERVHAVMTLLAGLELGRRRVVSLRQRRPFTPLWLYRGSEAGERGAARVPGDVSETPGGIAVQGAGESDADAGSGS